MANKTEFKKILKEFKLTEEQFQEIYEDVAKTNSLVNNLLNISKIKLQDLPPHLLRQLPTQKEKDLESIKQKNEEERLKKEADDKVKKEKHYYEKHFEEIMLKKIDNKENLNEDELKRLALEYDIEREEGESGRWARQISSIIELMGRYFIINWQSGLTEYQDNEFDEQPYEVIKKVYEKTIKVTEWVKV